MFATSIAPVQRQAPWQGCALPVGFAFPMEAAHVVVATLELTAVVPAHWQMTFRATFEDRVATGPAPVAAVPLVQRASWSALVDTALRAMDMGSAQAGECACASMGTTARTACSNALEVLPIHATGMESAPLVDRVNATAARPTDSTLVLPVNTARRSTQVPSASPRVLQAAVL